MSYGCSLSEHGSAVASYLPLHLHIPTILKLRLRIIKKKKSTDLQISTDLAPDLLTRG